MPAVAPYPLPEDSLLDRYRRAGAYTDCYRASLTRRVSLAEFVEAFYTGRLFKIERLILAVILSKASSDEQAKQLAKAETEHFSAWRVESRTDNQLLLCDVFGHTRSWLMCAGGSDGAAECVSAWNIGSDSLSMKFAGPIGSGSRRNQRHGSTASRS